MTWHANNNEAMKIVFKGDFYANVIQGTGTLKKSNGDIYKGFFENAQFNGEGIYIWAGGKTRYKGEFRNGLIHGCGILHAVNGIYEGDLRRGLMEGKGIMNFFNGDKYSGEFTNSTMTGYGCYTASDGTKVIGYFDDGICNRHAKKIYADGKIYIGEFENDIENGKGVLIDAHKKIKGIWKDANLVEELVSHDVNYDQSLALNQYASCNTQDSDQIGAILPSELKQASSLPTKAFRSHSAPGFKQYSTNFGQSSQTLLEDVKEEEE